MEGQLNVHALNRDELAYEIKIRLETPALTVSGMRKQLRGLLGESPSEHIIETEYGPEEELLLIKQKVSDLSSLVEKFCKFSDRYSGVRSKALGQHLFYRLLRVQPSDKVSVETKQELSLSLEALLQRIATPSQRENLSDEETYDTPAETLRDKPVQACLENNIVAKWKVKFDGVSDPRSFLDGVEDLKLSYGISDHTLFGSISLLLVDQALIWFRGVRTQVDNWFQFRSLLLEEFEPVDYEYRLLGEIRARTQGLEEPVHIYFSIMFSMFGRLKSALSEEEKLQILLHNIRPFFSQQLALIEVNSIADLKSKCRRLEAAQQRAALFSEPKNSPSVLGSEFAYQRSKIKQVAVVHGSDNSGSNERNSKTTSNSSDDNSVSPNSHVSVISSGSNHRPSGKRFPGRNVPKGNQSKFSGSLGGVSRSEVAGPVTIKKGQSDQSSGMCYKCGKGNHNFKECKETPDVIRCFTCGQIGYFTKTCPSCSKNKNSKN